VLGYLGKWVELSPFDQKAHEAMLQTLGRRGLVREGEEHLATTARLFESEGLNWTPLRDAWRSAKTRLDNVVRTPVAAMPVPAPSEDAARSVAIASRRASIAVMPFADASATRCAPGTGGDALAYDLITRLAKLRALFVIAQGSVFALNEQCVDTQNAGRMLNVDYTVSGSLRKSAERLVVTVNLTDARTARVVWAEIFDIRIGDTFVVLDDIGNRIVASIVQEIETIERNRAILKPPNSLDAWEAHHRGLWHMYRFDRAENETARHFFEMALRLDPTFSRAYAGLSFTHFQNAFQAWGGERQREIDRAYDTAGQSLMIDDRDPAAHWAMGRALWLRGRHDSAILELGQAIDLSPNFALGHYTLAFVQAQAGDADAAIAAADHSRQLSPFDPLLFGMLASRAIALVRLGRFDEAADWGMKAAALPNAHAHIQAIAAYSLALAGRSDDARSHLASFNATLPAYGIDDLLTGMRFAADGAELFRKGAKLIGTG
jgi:TolB-like protein/tetratricopeptide (TPR) repeat protein